MGRQKQWGPVICVSEMIPTGRTDPTAPPRPHCMPHTPDRAAHRTSPAQRRASYCSCAPSACEMPTLDLRAATSFMSHHQLRAATSPRPESCLLPRLCSIHRRDARAGALCHHELHARPSTSALPRTPSAADLHAPPAPCTAADLRAAVDLRNNEPPFVQATW